MANLSIRCQSMIMASLRYIKLYQNFDFTYQMHHRSIIKEAQHPFLHTNKPDLVMSVKDCEGSIIPSSVIHIFIIFSSFRESGSESSSVLNVIILSRESTERSDVSCHSWHGTDKDCRIFRSWSSSYFR